MVGQAALHWALGWLSWRRDAASGEFRGWAFRPRWTSGRPRPGGAARDPLPRHAAGGPRHRNADGRIDLEEFAGLLEGAGRRADPGQRRVNALIAAVERDADGRVDAEEFRRLFQDAENRQRRWSNTSMPDRDWWGSLWPEPADTLLHLGLRPGMAMLDVGCGYGLFTIPAARLVEARPEWVSTLTRMCWSKEGAWAPVLPTRTVRDGVPAQHPAQHR
ncbi:hypothetical protein KBY81_06100 [Cyanobium sp. Lug-B]|nr:hypothetical protein [Cyanobium sp. Lug-B]